MNLKLSGQSSVFGGVFFVFKSFLGIERQKKLKTNSFLLILLSKMFYGHAIFIGGNCQKGSRYLSFPPGLSLSRPVDTKTDFNLNNTIATLSLIYFYFFTE